MSTGHLSAREVIPEQVRSLGFNEKARYVQPKSSSGEITWVKKHRGTMETKQMRQFLGPTSQGTNAKKKSYYHRITSRELKMIHDSRGETQTPWRFVRARRANLGIKDWSSTKKNRCG